MEYLRQTVDSNELCNVFDLPLSLRNKKVDVIILPAVSHAAPKKASSSGSVYGSLKRYANPALIPQEEGAWARAMVEKYANR